MTTSSSCGDLAGWPYPRWIAHRGAGKQAPENTLAAFRVGAAQGFRMFECDVKLSADGKPFLLHDAELDRTTSGHGPAGDLAWRALARLDAGAWHSARYVGEPLLSLDTLAAWLRANRCLVNLEIKASPGRETVTGETVARAGERLWRGDAVQPLLSSFSIASLEGARMAAPSLPRALLLDECTPSWLADAQALGCVAIVPRQGWLTAEVIAQAHGHGLKVLTYTVNTVARADELWLAGLDGLITDEVDLFRPQASAFSNLP